MANTKRSARQADPEVTTLIREKIVALWNDGRGQTFDQIGELLGVTRQTIMSIKKGEKGAGSQLEQNAAELWFKGSIDSLRRAARGDETAIELDPEEQARRDGDLAELDAETPTPPPGGVGNMQIAVPKIGNLPNWPQLVKTAKQMEPGIPEWVYDRLKTSNPMLDGPVSASGFIGLLQWIWKHTPPPAETPSNPRRR